MAEQIDRELLEGAAKAAGLVLLQVPHASQLYANWWAYSASQKPNTARPWNPLEDDGDCARLVTALMIDLVWGAEGVWAIMPCNLRKLELYADHNGDKGKARRYASTRAAAITEGGGE